MSDEIKEILDRLERIDHKEYSCGFEFADSGSFDEDCRCFEERKKLADYITNLQKENERLNNIINELNYGIKELDDMFYETFRISQNGYYSISEWELKEFTDKLQELKENNK